ncbi:MAG: aminotransferase class I/II-fold pyridoxal phosphate-dependent enzyme [Actinomyces sp.]|uniref:MalY/PatB family protein n=1 Tax=Actinomyces sp. TaxID=29317 RepID=UPI0026DC9037|nr:aminotransferase class I/II-fold pyridoxal phosphate-dependent enzyme [Actinomyces sp.]MDO4243362.1 aminotransferase class I/II-fold pyridoxal phosphate-dependent enzyme [Actinomyces sp.]
MTVPFDAGSTLAEFDALTPQVLRSRGSVKWTQYPGDVIAAWVAEMDLGTAPAVRIALEGAVRDTLLGYMPAGLALAARTAVSRFHEEAFGWPVPVEDVSLLPDVLSALAALIEHHTRPGSAVIVPTPAYMPFLSIPGHRGRRCIEVPALRGMGDDPSWALDLEAIEAAMAQGAGLLVLCNPWNPVGRVLSPAELDAVAALSTRYGVIVFADEIHSPLVLDPTASHTPYASRPTADPALTFTATAVSKGWNVPGLRCAQLIASGPGRRAWQSCPLSAGLDDQASVLGATAAVAALSPEGLAWNAVVRDYVRANAELLARALAPVEGVEVTVPQGTYLAWLDCTGLGLPDGLSPAAFFRREPGVVMNAGRAFGAGYEDFCRLNLATGRAIEEQTVSRLLGAVAGLS